MFSFLRNVFYEKSIFFLIQKVTQMYGNLSTVLSFFLKQTNLSQYILSLAQLFLLKKMSNKFKCKFLLSNILLFIILFIFLKFSSESFEDSLS